MRAEYKALGYDIQTTMMKTSSGVKVNVGKITESGKQMGNGFQQGAKRGISGLLSLQSFVGKIVHYITFSIGVQMVMMVRQGFQNMIEDFKEYRQKRDFLHKIKISENSKMEPGIPLGIYFKITERGEFIIVSLTGDTIY